MNTPEKPDYGEPWIPDLINPGLIRGRDKQLVRPNIDGISRIVQCVNAMAGVPDPAAAMARLRQIEEQINSFDGAPAKPDAPIPVEVDPFCCMKARCKDWERHGFQLSNQLTAAMARLAQLEWVPVTERLPERDDANEFEDVEWSDGKDIWQGNYRNEDNATHWRRITLP